MPPVTIGAIVNPALLTNCEICNAVIGNRLYSRPTETGEICLSCKPLDAFNAGVRYALDYLEAVYGEGIQETDLWAEYMNEEETCDECGVPMSIHEETKGMDN